ncbi:lipopolysaccharide biosynthesis protein [Microbacterium sp. CR_7]
MDRGVVVVIRDPPRRPLGCSIDLYESTGSSGRKLGVGVGSQRASLGDAAARGASVTLAGQLYRTVLQFVSIFVLARLLSPDDFGLIAMVAAVIGISELFRDFGLSSAAIQAAHVSRDERTNLFWVNTGLGTACAVVVALAAPLVGLIYSRDEVPAIVLVMSIGFVLSGMVTQYRADLTRRLRFLGLSVTEAVAPTVGFAVGILLALQGFGYWALVVQQLSSSLVLLVLSVAIARWLPGLPKRQTSIRRFMRFGAALFVTQLISYGTKNVDNIAIGVVWGAGPLGFYDRAYQLLMAPLNQINAPMTRVALPVLSRVHEEKERFAGYLLKAQIVGGYATATLFALASGMAPAIVDVLFGPKWAPMAPIFAVLAIGGVLRATAQVSYWMFLATAQTGAQLRMFLVVRPIMIVVILAGLPWGAFGVAVGSTVAYALHWIVSLLWASRVTGVSSRPLIANILRILLTVSVPCGVIAFGISLLGWTSIVTVIVAIIASILYLAFIALVSRQARADLLTVVSFIRRALGRSSR